MQQNNSKESNQSIKIEFNFIEIVRILLNSKRLIILTTIIVLVLENSRQLGQVVNFGSIVKRGGAKGCYV